MLAGKENMDEEVEKQKREAQRNKMREDIAKRKEQLRLQVRKAERKLLFFQIFTRSLSEKPCP